MQDLMSYITSVITSEYVVLPTSFIFGITLFYVAYLFIWPSVHVSRRVNFTRAKQVNSAALKLASEHSGPDAPRIQEAIETFYNSLQVENKNAISRRLVRAGFFGQSAVYYFYAVRVALSLAVFVGAATALPMLMPASAISMVFYVAGTLATLALLIPSFVLDRMGKQQEERYRRSFPDFMDMLIVCADAGLSLEAAVARVARDTLSTNREFGIHLNIMMLEVRAGKRLREALTSFAERLAIEEARSLATVFKQSEELGASLTQTLRVFSHEMRRTRITRAEEKANALPVKMILPLGVFIFPVMLLIVLLPVMLTLLKMISSNMPG